VKVKILVARHDLEFDQFLIYSRRLGFETCM